MRDHPPTTWPMTLVFATATVHQQVSMCKAVPSSWKVMFVTMAFRWFCGLLMLPGVNSSQVTSSFHGEPGEDGYWRSASAKISCKSTELRTVLATSKLKPATTQECSFPPVSGNAMVRCTASSRR